jgi:hypothetical protein
MPNARAEHRVRPESTMESPKGDVKRRNKNFKMPVVKDKIELTSYG